MADSLKVTGKFLGKTSREYNGTIYEKFYLDITDKPEYPSTPEFSIPGSKTGLVDSFKAGDEMTVYFNLNGRKWEKDGRKGVINNLSAWKVEPPAQVAVPVDAPAQPAVSVAEPDDLPF